MDSLDPSASILQVCRMSYSQENLLAHRRFALISENVECSGSHTQSPVCDGIPVASTGIIMISHESSDDKEIRLSSAEHQTPVSLARKEHDDEEMNQKTPSKEPRLSSTDRQTPSSPEDPFRPLLGFCNRSPSQEAVLRHCHYAGTSETQSTAGISVASEEIDRKIESKESRLPSFDEGVDLGRDTDIPYESGYYPYSQRFEICSEDEQCRKRGEAGSTTGTKERIKDWAKRVLPSSICERGGVEAEEMKKENISILDVLEVVSKGEKYDDNIRNLSVLEVAKRCEMIFP